MAVLLIAEVNGGELSVDSTAKALTAAKQMGEVTLLCVGSGCASAAEAAAKLEGVSKVLCAQNDAYGHDLAEPVAALIVSLASDYSHIVAPSTSASKNILPRVAALLDVMVISEVTAVIDADTFERPIYAGNAIQTVKSTDATKVATIRTSTFDATVKAAQPQSPVLTPPAIPACPLGWKIRLPKATALNSHLQELWSPAAAGLAHKMISKLSKIWPTHWAPQWAHLEQRLILAMRRMTGKWGKPVRLLHQISMLPLAFRGQSSIWRA